MLLIFLTIETWNVQDSNNQKDVNAARLLYKRIPNVWLENIEYSIGNIVYPARKVPLTLKGFLGEKMTISKQICYTRVFDNN